MPVFAAGVLKSAILRLNGVMPEENSLSRCGDLILNHTDSLRLHKPRELKDSLQEKQPQAD
jgi:hypothetical protein